MDTEKQNNNKNDEGYKIPVNQGNPQTPVNPTPPNQASGQPDANLTNHQPIQPGPQFQPDQTQPANLEQQQNYQNFNQQPVTQVDVTKQGPTKKKTLKIIGGLVGVSAVGVFLVIMLQNLVFGDVAGDFDKLTTYEDTSGYVVQIPEEWQIEDGRQIDRFARDLEDQNSLAGIVVSDTGTIPDYINLNDFEKDQKSIANLDAYSAEILNFYKSTGSSASMVRTSTDTLANSDRSMLLEADVQTSVGSFRALNTVKVFPDGTAYAIAVVVPLESWETLNQKVYDIVNGFKVN